MQRQMGTSWPERKEHVTWKVASIPTLFYTFLICSVMASHQFLYLRDQDIQILILICRYRSNLTNQNYKINNYGNHISQIVLS